MGGSFTISIEWDKASLEDLQVELSTVSEYSSCERSETA